MSAFECTGIVPFNPHRVLSKFSGTAAPDPKTPALKIPAPPTPANNRAVQHLHYEVQQRLKDVDDPIVQVLVNKLANATIGGLTKGYLQEDRAAQLEAALAIKTEEMKDVRKRTKLTDAKAITRAALFKLRLQQQAQPSMLQSARV